MPKAASQLLPCTGQPVLLQIDKVLFGWYHVRAVTVAGTGFFTDSYDIFAINPAISMLGLTFYQGDSKGKVPDNIQTAIKAATFGRAVIGQIGFGWLADILGWRRIYRIELITIIVSTFAQSLSAPSSAVVVGKMVTLWHGSSLS
jgi:MFS transporter, PHS family, inorganic phosphate transporter